MEKSESDVYTRAAFAFTFIACSECDEDIACSSEFQSDHDEGSDEWYHAMGNFARAQGWLVMVKSNLEEYFILCPKCRTKHEQEVA